MGNEIGRDDSAVAPGLRQPIIWKLADALETQPSVLWGIAEGVLGGALWPTATVAIAF